MSIEYDKATYCTKGPAKGTASLAALVKKTFPYVSHTGIFNCRNVRGGDNLSTHAEGRGLDIHVKTIDNGNAIRDWLFANRYMYGLQEIIWNRKIWTSNRENDGFRPYKGANPHTDHVHTAQNRKFAGIEVDSKGVIPGAERLVFAGLMDANGSFGLESLSKLQVGLPVAIAGTAIAVYTIFKDKQ